MMRYVLIILLLQASLAHSQELLLHVKAKHIKHMGVPPIDDCNLKLEKENKGSQEEGEAFCWQFYSWHTYKARVKKVIYGELKTKTVEFAVYAHTEFNKQYLQDLYVRLRPLDEERKDFLKVDYYAVDRDSPDEIICFEEKLPKKFDHEYMGARGDEYHCYYSEELNQDK